MTSTSEQFTAFSSQSTLNPQVLPLQTSSAAYGLVDSTQLLSAGSFSSAIAPSMEQPAPPIADGDTLSTAINLGSLSGRVSQSGSVSSSDRFDYFQFTTSTFSKLDVTLTGAGTGDADIYLIRDFNGNGIEDPGEAIASSALNGNSEAFSVNSLASGTYFALVEYYSGGTANYSLTLTADTAGDSSSSARNLGTLTGSGSVTDFVGQSDLVDTYRFSLNNPGPSDLSLSLTGLSADADLYLYRENPNGILDSTNLLSQSINFGNASELLSLPGLASGNYYIRVEQFSGDTNYTLGFSTSPTDPGNTLLTAADLGSVTGRRSLNGNVSATNLHDIYRFTNSATSDLQLTLTGLSTDADLYFIQDKNNNGAIDAGETIEYSTKSGTSSETINVSGLAAGNYFVDVARFSGSTNYTLTFDVDSASKTLTAARDIGTLTGTRSFNDFIGDQDAVDNYRFTTTTASSLTIRLDGMTADGDLYLIRDSNGNGAIESNEIIAVSATDSTNPENITVSDLAAGTYYVQVNQYSGNTNYKLTLSQSPTRPDPGSTLATASSLGTLSGQRVLTDSLNLSNVDDIYRFSLNTTSDVQLALTGLSSNADLFLIQDRNNNGTIDSGDGLQSSTSVGSLTEFVNVANLAAGNYFVDVRGYGNTTNYTLKLTSDAAGNTIATARNVSTLSGFRSFTDFISPQDPDDLYRFSLSSTSNVTISLPGSTADMNLYLGRDFNGNGFFDAGEVLGVSATIGSNNPENISATLTSGTYYVLVEQFAGEGNYTLNLSALSI